MALETGTHISDLNAANPVSTDGLAQADDHLRLIKALLARIPCAHPQRKHPRLIEARLLRQQRARGALAEGVAPHACGATTRSGGLIQMLHAGVAAGEALRDALRGPAARAEAAAAQTLLLKRAAEGARRDQRRRD